ncbi:DUF5343 domain-containing protein [Mesorhizobium sp. 10J20-29]
MDENEKQDAREPEGQEAQAAKNSSDDSSKSGPRREIKGGIPYTTSPGVLKRALELIVQAERPEKFSANYMETVLKLTGGGARAVPPFLKKMQFIGSDGAPTNLYSKFKTDGGRSQAAYEGLKNSFSELFRRNEYIYKADEGAVKDVIVEITGLKKTDQIVRLMYSSFDAVRGFISGSLSNSDEEKDAIKSSKGSDKTTGEFEDLRDVGNIGLSYQINIVLPETENIAVFNAIFRSLRENLLR